MAIVQKSISSYPTDYTTSGSINGTRYKNAIGKGADTDAVSGNDYASGGSSSTAHIDYSFEFADIPEDAEIIEVSCQVKGHLENKSRSTANLQLYAGTVAKGSASKFSSTSAQTITLTTGTWTRAEIDNLKLRFTIGYYGGLVNGATVTVTYSYNDVTYTISINNSTTATVSADPAEVSPGHSSTIKADRISGLRVTDNGTDITSQFEERTDDPDSYTVENVGQYGFDLESSGYYVSNNKGISKTAAVCRVNIYVPVAATVTFTFINYSEEGYDFGVFGNADVALNHNYYTAGKSGAEISDDSYRLACNTSTYNNSSQHTLSYSISAGEHYIDVKYSKDDASDAHNDTLQFKVSISLDEPYSPVPYYAYDITNIQSNHTIIVVSSGDSEHLFVKKSNVYKEAIKAWKKQNGTYTEIPITDAFSADKKYVCGD